jgi:hypothetical protein
MAGWQRFRSPVPVLVGLFAALLFPTPAVAADRGGMIEVIINFEGRPGAAALRTIENGGVTPP